MIRKSLFYLVIFYVHRERHCHCNKRKNGILSIIIKWNLVENDKGFAKKCIPYSASKNKYGRKTCFYDEREIIRNECVSVTKSNKYPFYYTWLSIMRYLNFSKLFSILWNDIHTIKKFNYEGFLFQTFKANN